MTGESRHFHGMAIWQLNEEQKIQYVWGVMSSHYPL